MKVLRRRNKYLGGSYGQGDDHLGGDQWNWGGGAAATNPAESFTVCEICCGLGSDPSTKLCLDLIDWIWIESNAILFDLGSDSIALRWDGGNNQ